MPDLTHKRAVPRRTQRAPRNSCQIQTGETRCRTKPKTTFSSAPLSLGGDTSWPPERDLPVVDSVSRMGKMAAKLAEVSPDRWNSASQPSTSHAEPNLAIFAAEGQVLGIEVRGAEPANRRIHGVNFAVAAFEDPFQHTAVLAIGPEGICRCRLCGTSKNGRDRGQLCAALEPIFSRWRSNRPCCNRRRGAWAIG